MCWSSTPTWSCASPSRPRWVLGPAPLGSSRAAARARFRVLRWLLLPGCRLPARGPQRRRAPAGRRPMPPPHRSSPWVLTLLPAWLCRRPAGGGRQAGLGRGRLLWLHEGREERAGHEARALGAAPQRHAGGCAHVARVHARPAQAPRSCSGAAAAACAPLGSRPVCAPAALRCPAPLPPPPTCARARPARAAGRPGGRLHADAPRGPAPRGAALAQVHRGRALRWRRAPALGSCSRRWEGAHGLVGGWIGDCCGSDTRRTWSRMPACSCPAPSWPPSRPGS